jgi:hypothetical protein
MYLKYGNYSHTLNEASLSISKNSIDSDQNIHIGHQTNWTIQGVLLADPDAADPVADLTTQITNLKNAYKYNKRSIALYEDDNTKTAHAIDTNKTIQGVRVASMSFPQGIGAEYATKRTYQITITADHLHHAAARAGSLFFESSETISTTGNGGPRYVIRETRFGSPVRQMVSTATPVRVSQTGHRRSIVRPASPTPLYSNYEVLPARQINISFNPKDKFYNVNYSFQFEAPHQI